MTKKRVLIVHNYYQTPGGEDTVVANEKKLLEKHGHDVILYSRHNSELKNMSNGQKLFLPISTIFSRTTYKEVRKIIKEYKIEIVHVHNTLSLISPSVYYAARSLKIPVVQTIHNFRFLCPGATFNRDGHICEECVQYGLKCAIKYSCYRNNRIQTIACVLNMYIHRMTGIYRKINYICLTEFNKKKLLELKQIQQEQVYVKPNFVDSKECFIAEQNREEQFIFAGRLEKLKGIDILFEAWKRWGSDAPKLIVCGTGPMEEWCEEFVRRNKVNIDLYGYIPNVEVQALIAKSKALILPTQWYEGFPMSIVEAFSVGTPVVCSDLGNAGSIVEEGVSGCKFRADSVEELLAAIQRCRGIYESTLHKFKEDYTAENNYRNLINIYIKVENENE